VTHVYLLSISVQRREFPTSELSHSLLHLEQKRESRQNVNQNDCNPLPCWEFLCEQKKRTTLEATLGHLGLVVSHHLLETHTHRPARLPIERGLSTRRIRPALLRVILRQTLMYDIDAAG
jgi:hypothetical protein